mgnify:CR=1
MNDQPMVIVGYLALAVVAVWVIALAVTYWRDNAPTRPAKQPWRIEITHYHQFPEGAFNQLETIAQELKHTTMVHELGEQTVQDVDAVISAHVRGWFDLRRDERENIPKAQSLAMPPEPEERIARDLTRAKAVLRGANALQQEAKSRGLSLSQEEAMRQAAEMLHNTLDQDER